MLRTQSSALVALLIIIAIVALGAINFGEAKERVENLAAAAKDESTRDAFPPAVLAAFHSAYPKADIMRLDQKTEGDTTYYEIESKEGKVRRNVLYTADGTMMEVREYVKPADLPEKIVSAAKHEFPFSKIESSRKITRDGVVHYSLDMRRGNDKRRLSISADGDVTKSVKRHAKTKQN